MPGDGLVAQVADAPDVGSGVFTALIGAFVGMASVMASLILRRDKRAANADAAAAAEGLGISVQWQALVEALSRRLDEADDRCRVQMDAMRADYTAQIDELRRELHAARGDI